MRYVLLSFVCVLVIVSISSSAIIPNNNLNQEQKHAQVQGDVWMKNELIQSLREVGSKNSEQVWRTIFEFIQNRDLHGLVAYLEKLPETQLVLNWLKLNYPDIFLGVCWLFDACDVQDIVIPPSVIQNIMRLIAANDWDGLVTYLKSLDEFEDLADWIKTNFPEAWSNICHSIDIPC